jgi:hypothetical protein
MPEPVRRVWFDGSMDTKQDAGLGRHGVEHATVADQLLTRLAEVDAADAPAVADDLAEELLIALDLREDGAEAAG